MKFLIILLMLFFSSSSLPNELVAATQINVRENGILKDKYNTKEDRFSLELGGSVNLFIPETVAFNQQYTMRFAYYKQNSFNWGFFIQQIGINFLEINNNISNLKNVGIGLIFRSGLIRTFIKYPQVSDEISSFISYAKDSDGILKGYGFVSSYNLIWRFSKRFHTSTKLRYNLYSYEKDEESNISSFSFNWVDCSFNIGFYF